MLVARYPQSRPPSGRTRRVTSSDPENVLTAQASRAGTGTIQTCSQRRSRSVRTRPYGEEPSIQIFDKVALDGDTGETVCVVHVEKSVDDRFEGHVTPLCETDGITVSIDDE
ncbi:hypothetical protein [Streptomyces sp. NPDC007083]|uniref:hypothetical protein n=1 Tax=Streptomyces sp. NPDC007083 TaxID=3156913 RepID=UPI0033E35736